MRFLLVLAGLTVEQFDRVSAISASRLVPDGELVAKPNKRSGAYSPEHAAELIERANKALAAWPEQRPASVLLAYADFGEESTTELLTRFFPFSLPAPFPPLAGDGGSSRRARNEALNLFQRDLLGVTEKLRANARQIYDFTSVANLSPLLLPVRNFRDDALTEMLSALFATCGNSEAPGQLVRDAVASFRSRCPLTKAPEDARHCFSDGELFFRSPGKDRHGFFRNSKAAEHSPECLLNARSRIGGGFSHDFHFDCVPAKRRLAPSFSSCHGDPRPPKANHVNIAPNDYII